MVGLGFGHRSAWIHHPSFKLWLPGTRLGCLLAACLSEGLVQWAWMVSDALLPGWNLGGCLQDLKRWLNCQEQTRWPGSLSSPSPGGEAKPVTGHRDPRRARSSPPASLVRCAQIAHCHVLGLMIPCNRIGVEQGPFAEKRIFKLAFKSLRSKGKHKRNKNQKQNKNPPAGWALGIKYSLCIV